ncbi:protein phosphatase 2C domain-containing protein [Streptomyces sp. NPDC047928]|uniref:protein phosphatase 2C domain-containing protein n=1 Tax=unclassified Streptomyces TaxID=2593676 RepID=UPI003714D596
MNPQGETPATGDDGWWEKLYDETVPDTAGWNGRGGPGDTLDDRFASAADTVTTDPRTAPDDARTGARRSPHPARDPARTPEEPPAPPGREPWDRAPWEPPVDRTGTPRTFPQAPPTTPAAFPAPAPPASEAPAVPPEPGPPPDPARPPERTTGTPPTTASGPTTATASGTTSATASGPTTTASGPTSMTASGPTTATASGTPPMTASGPTSATASGPTTATGTESGAAVGPPSGSGTAPGLPRPRVGHVGDGPPTYDPEPTALPAAHPDDLGALVADTVLDGARYGTFTLRAASVRGDSARYRGEHRRDALLTARFGTGDTALLLVAVATGARATEGARLAAADACRWIGEAVGRSHARLSEDIRAGRRGDLKSGLHRLTDRSFGRLRARAAELGVGPEAYTASLRCLLLTADPGCRTRVFFGVGAGGLFRLRDGAWQDLEPPVPEPAAVTGEPVVGFGSPPHGATPPVSPVRPPDGPSATAGHLPGTADGPTGGPADGTPAGDRLTMRLGIPAHPSAPYVEDLLPPPAEPFRFRASVARPGDTLLLAGAGLAEPLRDEPALARELAGRWGPHEPPGLAAFLADTQLRVKGYADDRTAVAIWEA